MIGILLVTHGRLAEELKAAALIIQPDISSIVAVALEWNQTGEDARERGQRSICVASDLLADETAASAAASESRER